MYESFKQMFFPHQSRLQRQLLIFHYIEKFWICLGKVFIVGVFSYCCNCLGLYWVYIFVWGCLYVVFLFLGVFVFWGVRDILNARAIYLQIEEAWA
jgi:hypothetical protein